MLDAPPGLPERYRLTRLLGKGGQARTFLAEDEDEERLVAIKVFELRDAEGWKGFELFERECRVLRSLDHPHVVEYVEHGGDEDRGIFFLVMEYAEGPTLEQGLQDGKRYTDEQLIELLRQLLKTLQYLHSLNPPVFHRDIKPGNVVLTEQGAMLVDFGGVRDVFSDRSKSTVVGTFGYMAPEQLRGDASPASDLYGLGATIAAIASGTDAAELPHGGLEIDLEQCVKPGKIRDVLAAMLRADPRQRVATAADALRLLDDDSHALARPQSTAVAPSDDGLQEVESLAKRGETIAAVRRYRELTGASLPEARHAVHSIAPVKRRGHRSLAGLAPSDAHRVRQISGGATVLVLMTSIVASAPVGVIVALSVFTFLFSRFVATNIFRGYRSAD